MRSWPRPSLRLLAASFGLAGLLLAADSARSQQFAEVEKTPEEELSALVEANKALLKKQAETLKRLEEIKKEAAQLRIYVKRG